MDDFDLKGALINWLVFFALIALTYLIGRTFGRLASRHNKGKWQFAFWGILVFLLGVYLVSVIESIIKENEIFKLTSGVLRLPIGLISCWMFYRIIGNKWTKLNNH